MKGTGREDLLDNQPRGIAGPSWKIHKLQACVLYRFMDCIDQILMVASLSPKLHFQSAPAFLTVSGREAGKNEKKHGKQNEAGN